MGGRRMSGPVDSQPAAGRADDRGTNATSEPIEPTNQIDDRTRRATEDGGDELPAGYEPL